MICLTRRLVLAGVCLLVVGSAGNLHAKGVILSTTSLHFEGVGLGTTETRTVHLTNTGTAAVVLAISQPGAPFSQTNTCSTLACHATCSVTVEMSPTAPGSFSGSFIVSDNLGDSPQTVALTGSGSFSSLISISIAPLNDSLTVGATQQYTATGQFPSSVTWDLTDLVYWKSSSSKIAAVSNVPGSQGLVTADAVGTTKIAASRDEMDISGSTSLTVATGGKITPTIAWSAPAAITYGVLLSTTQLNAVPSVPGTLTYTPAAGTSLGAGTQTLSVSFVPTNTSAYNSASASVMLTVSKAPLTVTAGNASRAYGAANPGFTAAYSGFVGTDSVAVLSGAPSLTTAATAASPVSAYPITAAIGTLAASNYSFAFVNGTLTVSQALASVTPNPASKIYGTTDPALTGTLTGFLTADGVTAMYTRAAGQTVAGGPYPISAVLSPAGVLGNYSITYNTANFTIAQASATVSAIAPARPMALPILR